MSNFSRVQPSDFELLWVTGSQAVEIYTVSPRCVCFQLSEAGGKTARVFQTLASTISIGVVLRPIIKKDDISLVQCLAERVRQTLRNAGHYHILYSVLSGVTRPRGAASIACEQKRGYT